MSGLVYRDLLTFYRKNTKVTYIMEAVYFLFFLLVLRNIYGAITFLVIASPISMSGLPATMKDLDTNYKGHALYTEGYRYSAVSGRIFLPSPVSGRNAIVLYPASRYHRQHLLEDLRSFIFRRLAERRIYHQCQSIIQLYHWSERSLHHLSAHGDSAGRTFSDHHADRFV